MPKVIVTEFVSLDGVMEAPDKWVFDFHDDDSLDFKVDEMRHVDALLLGRHTYDTFAEAWPSRTGELADRMNGVCKYVVSSRTADLIWHNSRRLDGDVAAAVAELKGGPGGDILVVGSASLVETLGEHGLIDEYRLFLCPVVLGSGRRLLTTPSAPQRLQLVESRAFDTGAILLRYEVE